MGKWDSYCHSVAGKRDTNEDGALILDLGRDRFFFAVADGMGGVKGGEVASAVVLEYAREFLTARFAKAVRAGQMKKILRDLYSGADDAVGKAQKANPLLAGMGTTLVCMLVTGKKYVVGNIGDGRVYRSRGGSLVQVTRDHTYVQEMIASTGTKPDPGVLRNFSHILTRSIEGGKDKPDVFPVEEQYFTVADGESFLICSDGLILDKGAENDSTLEQIFRETENLKAAAEEMVEFALNSGSTDNVSVLLATWGEFRRHRREKPMQPAKQEVRTVSTGIRRAGIRRRLSVSAPLSLALLAILMLIALVALRAFGETRPGKIGIPPDWQPGRARSISTTPISPEDSGFKEDNSLRSSK